MQQFCNAADALEGADDFEAACRAYIKESLTTYAAEANAAAKG